MRTRSCQASSICSNESPSVLAREDRASNSSEYGSASPAMSSTPPPAAGAAAGKSSIPSSEAIWIAWSSNVASLRCNSSTVRSKRCFSSSSRWLSRSSAAMRRARSRALSTWCGSSSAQASSNSSTPTAAPAKPRVTCSLRKRARE